MRVSDKPGVTVYDMVGITGKRVWLAVYVEGIYV